MWSCHSHWTLRSSCAVCLTLCAGGSPDRSLKSISNGMKMQMVFLMSTRCCQSASQYLIAFSTPQNVLMMWPDVTRTNLSTEPFPSSLQINQSALLLCSLLMSILYPSIDFCHASIGLDWSIFIPLFNPFPPHPLGDCVIDKKEIGQVKLED